jgi:hypothetical protein
MAHTQRSALLALLFIALLGTLGLPRPSQAGLADTAIALAGPLAEQFGVPASAVTGLLESGISLDSVTQLLFVSKSSGTDLDAVSGLFRESGNDIDDTAEKLDVDAADYSEERVTAAIDEAKSKAQADATDKATKGVSDALGSALGGLNQ